MPLVNSSNSLDPNLPQKPDDQFEHFLVSSNSSNDLGSPRFSTKRYTALIMFVGLTLFLQFSLAILYFSGSPFARGPLFSSAILSAIVIIVYGALARFMPTEPRLSKPQTLTRQIILWVQLAIMLVALIATLIYIPTTAPLELAKRLLITDYTPQYSPLEIRLSAAYMPVWCQALLEFARRIAAPYCLIELVFGKMRRAVPPLLPIVVWILLILFTLTTLERAVGVLYFASAILALAFTKGIRRTLTSKHVYICLASIALVIVIFKQLQYGDFVPVSFEKNAEIIRELSAGTSGPTKPNIENNEQDGSLLRYVHYVAQSVTERIFLSPVAMIVYSSQTYNSSNFQHWRTTRLFSIFGYGSYVDPLQTVSEGHHEAFPVTFIGDLWRNGGPFYFPFYAILIGIILYQLDRHIFAEREFIALKVCASIGILFLFYGNAFNATSWASILTSISLAYILRRKAKQSGARTC